MVSILGQFTPETRVSLVPFPLLVSQKSVTQNLASSFTCFFRVVFIPISCVCVCSVVPDSATPWTVAHQLPLSMGFPKQEYWSGLPFPSLGDLPDPGIEPRSLALVGRFFTTEPPGKPPSSPLSPLYSVPSSSSCLFYGRSPALALLPSPLSGPLLCSQHE